MSNENFCIDIDGNKVRAGDTVEYYGIIGCEDFIGEGEVWVVGDMNEIQTNMPYIRGKGAWHPNAIRKVI
mgnify:FL=1